MKKCVFGCNSRGRNYYINNPEALKRDLRDCQFDEYYVNQAIAMPSEGVLKNTLDVLLSTFCALLSTLLSEDILDDIYSKISFNARKNTFYNALELTASYQRSIMVGNLMGAFIPGEYGLEKPFVLR